MRNQRPQRVAKKTAKGETEDAANELRIACDFVQHRSLRHAYVLATDLV